MTITQLEYIVAVANCKSFAKAAEQCHITQPTLSVQIKKLEAHLNVAIFDRSRKPVRPTELGLQVIAQARISLAELNRISEIIAFEQQKSIGQLRLGIIPTLGPYILPLFSLQFLQQNPGIQLFVNELISEEIIYQLYNNKLDIGLMVTPIDNPDLIQIPLFYEPFVLYISDNHPYTDLSQISIKDLDFNEMWLLNEGHCFRNQVINICQENNIHNNHNPLRFESGSLESIRRMVEQQSGYTMLPQLATLEFNEQQQQRVKPIDISPVREVSLVINRRFMQRKVVESMKQCILEHIPKNMQQKGGKRVIDWV